MDTRYTLNRWPGKVTCYMDLEWLQPQKLLSHEDIDLPEGYFLNPDETDENSIGGPMRNKVLELFDELNTPSLTPEMVDTFRRTSKQSQFDEFN